MWSQGFIAHAEALIRSWVESRVVECSVGRIVRVVPGESCQAAWLMGILVGCRSFFLLWILI